MPRNILDLYPEFRLSLCGLAKPVDSHTLLRALLHYGIEGMEEAEKATMRDLAISPLTKVTTLRNFPFQGNGSEMLRLAIILAVERGVKVCAPVHDALLIEAPVDRIEEAVSLCERAMEEASECVLPGFPLRTEHVIVRYPDRYMDGAGEDFWNKIWEMPFLKAALEELEYPRQLCPEPLGHP
jgi:hypothetical protein